MAGALGLPTESEAAALTALCTKAVATDGLDCKSTPLAVAATGLSIVLDTGISEWSIVFRTQSGSYALHRALETFGLGIEEYVAVPALAGSRYRVVVQHAENITRVECDPDDDPDCRPATGSEGFLSKTWVLDTETGRLVLSSRDDRPEECPSWGTVIVRGDTFNFPPCGEELRPTETRPAADPANDHDVPLWLSLEFVKGCLDGSVGAARARAATLGSDDKKRAAAAIARGRALTKSKRYSDAIAQFTASIQIDPSGAKAYSGRGYAHFLAGELDDGKADFEDALALTAGHTLADNTFRRMVRQNLDRLEERQTSEGK